MSSSNQTFLALPTPITLKSNLKKIKETFISFGGWIREAWKEALADLTARWRLILGVLWFAGLLASLVILGLFAFPPPFACRPDGAFSPFTGYTYWDVSGFFQITFAFGSLTFTEAKVIDTTWDILVGRVGQGILAYFSWHTFADYATISMETTPMTYSTFTILFTEKSPAFTSLCQLLVEVTRYRRLRSKRATAWVIMSMLFVLAWPTLIAAMTGYTPEIAAYVKDIEENLVPYHEFRLISYIIHDGERINLTGDYPVPLEPFRGTTSEPVQLDLTMFK
ncbi:hypothetical protein NPX13_g9159 [Xylaria arbuscula]|uniref:Uncharacterized protein n=1 Tax=Xylaria arbuscula TaxID=114810 RepID=A0A9W8N794_9PEZI|nr:hypothetical protein NPX13_g9159 [Xylaria arbuscula]